VIYLKKNINFVELKEVNKELSNKAGNEGTERHGEADAEGKEKGVKECDVCMLCLLLLNGLKLVTWRKLCDKQEKVFLLLKAIIFGDRQGNKEDNENEYGCFGS
jgi:hypothetical protein